MRWKKFQELMKIWEEKENPIIHPSENKNKAAKHSTHCFGTMEDVLEKEVDNISTYSPTNQIQNKSKPINFHRSMLVE